MKSYIRTRIEHIQAVQNRALYLIENHLKELGITTEEKFEFLKNITTHDSSCFDPEQAFPLTKYYNQMGYRTPTTAQLEMVKDATSRHYFSECHHLQGNANPSKIEAIQMACDLDAAQDGLNLDALTYFDNTLAMRAKTEETREVIRKTLKLLKKKKPKFALSYDEIKAGKTYEILGTRVNVKIVQKLEKDAIIELYGSQQILNDVVDLKFAEVRQDD